MPDDDAAIADVVRWETKCCGYTFNGSGEGMLPLDNEPLTVGVGVPGSEAMSSYIAGQCPGCGARDPELTKLTHGGEC